MSKGIPCRDQEAAEVPQKSEGTVLVREHAAVFLSLPSGEILSIAALNRIHGVICLREEPSQMRLGIVFFSYFSCIWAHLYPRSVWKHFTQFLFIHHASPTVAVFSAVSHTADAVLLTIYACTCKAYERLALKARGEMLQEFSVFVFFLKILSFAGCCCFVGMRWTTFPVSWFHLDLRLANSSIFSSKKKKESYASSSHASKSLAFCI